jgi:hypothetical protein
MLHAVKQARCQEKDGTVQLRAQGIAVLANWAQRCRGMRGCSCAGASALGARQALWDGDDMTWVSNLFACICCARTAVNSMRQAIYCYGRVSLKSP